MIDGLSIDGKKTVGHSMPRVVVIGVGGGGSNAVKNMIENSLEGCQFCVCNTDAQALEHSAAPHKFLLGADVTGGLGAGGNPEVGRKAAEESIQDIADFVDGADMVFLSVGMGGGTGTGAAPVIAKMIKEKDIVCVGVVSKPFSFESSHRMNVAVGGIEELQKHVDTLIVIPNENLISLVAPDATFVDALKTVDDVLLMGVRAVADLMIKPGQINLDFNDIRTVVEESGKAIIGIGEVSKSEHAENTAEIAAQRAISNSLLEYNNIGEAKAVLINVTASTNLSFVDMTTACSTVRKSVHPDANVIIGMSLNEDPEFNDIIRLSVLATGISNDVKSVATTKVGDVVLDAEETEPVQIDQDDAEQTPLDDGSFAYLDEIEPIDAMDSDDSYALNGVEETPPFDPLESQDDSWFETDNTDYETHNVDGTFEQTEGEESSYSDFTLSSPEPQSSSLSPADTSSFDFSESDNNEISDDVFSSAQKQPQQNRGFFVKLFGGRKQEDEKHNEDTDTAQQESQEEIPSFLKDQK